MKHYEENVRRHTTQHEQHHLKPQTLNKRERKKKKQKEQKNIESITKRQTTKEKKGQSQCTCGMCEVFFLYTRCIWWLLMLFFPHLVLIAFFITNFLTSTRKTISIWMQNDDDDEKCYRYESNFLFAACVAP
jgi:Flp pilus assembly protein TadB